VLLDGTFSARRWQQAVERLAEDTSSDLAVVECTARPSVAGARLRARSTDASGISGADQEVAGAMAADRHPWARARPVDTSDRSARQAADQVAGELGLRPQT
jgi:predicted kinase